ncbi:hypothetical protein [Desulfobulbus alkaliphilus]|uniref:hypothetical protein n=1 Tax=Desulfobulbus alkaliphilus TaxID=869814 RepID=UPI001964975C|nr:hypothetical protein [Desulfobulbus alkaliphilus]MBM9535478.1 hypothetical protein [Desulfobulbus alkaliphilus]
MKKSQREPVVKIDEFEDLTLFANESFDTQDVDLFEFSREESSPLTRLKSIILSLDWEINDEILQELADELKALDGTWADDKVAQVYLQGLSKIGAYLRAKGAYAHPNSIKLLLSFFYNFEKIISSQTITGEEITTLLKSDVRKFKILQYQINQSEGVVSPQVAPTTTAAEPPQPQALAPVETGDGKELKAAILSLDWEVSDDSLKQFNTSLSRYHEKVAGNKWAMVLTQGLQALGDYIGEEGAEAHAEAFILLHSFNDALEQVAQVDEKTIDPEQRETIENILVDQINRLNNLKMLIAAPSQPTVDEQFIEEVVDRLSTPAAMDEDDLEPAVLDQNLPSQPSKLTENFAIAMDEIATDTTDDSALEAELDTFFTLNDSKPAMESAEVQYPDEILPPDAIHPVDDELADDLIGAQLSDRRGIQPALADADELAGFNEDTEPLDFPAQSDLAEQLDFLFADADSDITSKSAPFKPLDTGPLDSVSNENLESVATLADVAPEDADFLTLDLQTSTDDQIPAALADTQAPDDMSGSEVKEEIVDQGILDIENKLDHFFADAADESSEPAAVATDHSADEVERALFFTEENGVESALADSQEERGFSEEEAIASLDYTPLGEIEEKLDFFFGSETDEQLGEEEETGLVMDVTGEKEPSVVEGQIPGPFTDEVREEDAVAKALGIEMTPALADADDLQVREEIETPAFDELELDGELEEKLDLFFDLEETAIDTEEPLVEMVAAAEEPVEALTRALEATIEEEQPPTVELAEEESVTISTGDEDRHIHLAALGALLPGIVRAASREQAAESTRIIQALNDVDMSAEHQSLLHMLQSMISLLARLPARDGAATEKVVNYLYEQLLQETCRPEVLTTAVQRFTAWLQEATALMPRVPTTADNTEEAPQFAYTAQELYFELTELRAQLKDEFAKLRHEMHHHNS